jgi:arginine decarboxylase
MSERSLDQSQTPYADAVKAYAENNFVRLHVPGHGADLAAHPRLTDWFGGELLRRDVPPLIDGIDQGATPTPLQQAARLAADAWGAHKSWLLTNGSSKGNLVTVLALSSLGWDIVAQRSMHSSVMDGMVLGELTGHWVQPVVDTQLGAAHGVTPESLATALDAQPEAVAAYVVTPSYFGAVADVAGLAAVAHARDKILVVDEAWGAHFGFHPDLPTNALRLGADLVISSVHKLGGSLTQSGLLHLGKGPYSEMLTPLVDRSFRSMQSTSSSSLLMASVDLVRADLATGQARIQRSLDAAAQMRDGIQAAGRFEELSARFMASPDVVAIDPLRVVVNTRVGGISGHQARQILFEEHHVHCEMATDSAVVAVIGAGAAPNVERVVAAFAALPDCGESPNPEIVLPEPGTQKVSMREAYFADAELVNWRSAIGRVSVDSLAAYPPGIPNVLPGEVLTEQVVEFLRSTAASPFGHVRGGAVPNLDQFRVAERL